MSMNAVAEAVCDLMGWADGESLRSRLARVVPEVASEFGLAPEQWRANHRFVREVAERATVNETYFFRHAEQLAATCNEVAHAFPTEAITCWSAACSTGEEPYSLAMQFALSGLPPERLEILGTDVCGTALSVARTARYPEWSFRGVPRVVREQCFSRVKSNGPGVSSYEVQERFRSPVRFASHNLLSPPPVRSAQLISCRNALIYLHPAAVQVVLRHLDSALVPGGFLMLGTAEQHFAAMLNFESVERGGVVLLRKPVVTRSVVEVTRPHPEPPPGGRGEQPQPRPTPPRTSGPDLAWRALRAGDVAQARAWAESNAAAQDAQAHFILATLEESAGDELRALEHLRRALYLDPKLVPAHVAQASLFRRLGRDKDASRARANALRLLEQLAPDTLLCGIHPLTARELKDALEAS